MEAEERREEEDGSGLSWGKRMKKTRVERKRVKGEGVRRKRIKVEEGREEEEEGREEENGRGGG